MDKGVRGEILGLFSELGIDTYSDADLARGCFIFLLANTLAAGGTPTEEFITGGVFKDHLDEYQVEPFKATGPAEDTLYCLRKLDGILKIYGLFDFRVFFGGLAPWAVSDWEAYHSNFNESHSEVLKCAALVYLLKCQASYAPGPAVFGDPASLYGSRPEIAAYWNENLGLSKELFAACWNAVFFYKLIGIQTKMNGIIKNAIDMYRQYHVPMTKLLSDYSDVKRYSEDLNEFSYNWVYLNKRKRGIPVESGMTVDETVFEFAAFYLQEERATDIIRAAFYPKSRNDSGFECSFLLGQFADILSEATKVLIVNPSPDFILKWRADKRFTSCNTCFAVPDKTVAACYRHEFRGVRFLPFKDIQKLDSVERVLIMSRDYPIDKLDDLLVSLSVCSETAQVLAVLPNAYIDSTRESFDEKLKDNNCIINKMLIIAPAATNSSPRKKVLLHLEKERDAAPHQTIPLYTSFCDKSGQFHIRNEHWDIPGDALFLGNKTILALQKNAEKEKANPSGEILRRNTANTYSFSREISIFYTIQKNRKQRFGGKAYYCETPGPENKNRRRGRRLTEIIEKGLRAKTESEVLAGLENIPFDPRVDPQIVRDICSAYADKTDTLSLKTIWFICRRYLLKNRRYDESAAKRLFCGECKELSDIVPSLAAYSPASGQGSHLIRPDVA